MRAFLITLLFATTAFAQVSRTIDADRFKRVTGVPGAIITLPNYAGQLPTLAGIETFTNKSLIAPLIMNPDITGGTVSGASIIGGIITNPMLTASGSILDNPNITLGVVSGATILNGTISGTDIFSVDINGSLITGSVFDSGIISGSTISGGTFNGTISGATIVNSTVSGGSLVGVTINGASNTITNLNTSSITSGVLPIARGGTNNGALSVSAGAIAYTDGSKIVTTTPGVSGQVLISQGASAPVFVNMYSVQAISGTVIDWSQASAYTRILTANTTFSFSNPQAGQNIIVRLTNTPSNYAVTWPASATLKWAGGTAPTQTTGLNGTDVYTFFYDGLLYYGSYVQDMK